ncbi:MAG: N-acetyltransferase [Chloroflexi bacterium]|nr:N-acetyltransferase [Chloroflexota bacterium]
MRVRIDRMTGADWPAVRTIYRQGILTGDATFEHDAPDWERWNREHLREGRLVARVEGQPPQGGEVVGWAALSAVSQREVYRGVVEASIYVATHARGQGVGKQLLQALIQEAERAGYWTIQAGVFPENVASLALLESCGFRRVGVRQRLGQMGGRWRDVVLLERRSDAVGV